MVCVNNPVVSSVNIEEQKRLRAELKNHRQELENSLRITKEKVRSETENKKSLDEQIEVVKSKIDESNVYISELNKKIERIQVRTSLLKEALVSIYVAGDTSALDIILGSKSFDDFLDKADIVRSVSETVKELMGSLKSSLEELEKEENSICEMREKQKEEIEQLEKSKIELQDLLDKSEKLILEYKENEREAEKEIDQNDAEIKAIDAQITRYYEEQRRREEEEKRKKQSDLSSPSKANISASNTSSLTISKGGYVWPVPGFRYISSGFYDCVNRSHMHGAIDVAGKGIYGSNIVAANGGIVIMSNTVANARGQGGGGYGKFVVIDHGNGVSTLYGHMSNVVVSPGQRVSRGQVIGQVGNTGFSTGPHLHFEFRVNGIRQNPLNYVGG